MESVVFVLQVCFYKVTAVKSNLSPCLFSQLTEREDDEELGGGVYRSCPAATFTSLFSSFFFLRSLLSCDTHTIWVSLVCWVSLSLWSSGYKQYCNVYSKFRNKTESTVHESLTFCRCFCGFCPTTVLFYDVTQRH